MKLFEKIAIKWGYIAYKNRDDFIGIIILHLVACFFVLFLPDSFVTGIAILVLIIAFIPIVVVHFYTLPQINLKVAIAIGEKSVAESDDWEFCSKTREIIQEAENEGRTERVRKWQKYMARLESPFPFFAFFERLTDGIFFRGGIADEEKRKIKAEIRDNL